MTSLGTALSGRVRSVSDVTARIKELLDGDAELADVWVEGEVSNFHPAASGHWYWTLKDGEASLRCVMWRPYAAGVATRPEDGHSIVAHGSVSVYAAQGQYQLYADHCEPAGQGQLYLAFERLKARLETEGLFDPARKRPLRPYPRRIVVVTSHGSPKWLNALQGESGKRTVTRSIRLMCSRRTRTTWCAIYGLDTCDTAARIAWLDRVERTLARM